MRKLVCGVFDQVRLRPAQVATAISWSLESFDIHVTGLGRPTCSSWSRQRKPTALIRLSGCINYVSLLFANGTKQVIS